MPTKGRSVATLVALPFFAFRCFALRKNVGSDANDAIVAANETVLEGKHQIEPVMIMAAYNVAASVVYAVRAVEEVSFRSRGFDQLTASAEVARSHINAMGAAAKGGQELEADGWLALNALEKLLDRVTRTCEFEHKGSWIQQSMWKVRGYLGQEKEKDDVFASAVLTLQSEHAAVKKSIAAVVENAVCPMLLQKANEEILAAKLAADSYANVTGESLFLEMADSEWVNPGSIDTLALPYTYVKVFDAECFSVPRADHAIESVDKSTRDEMHAESMKLFDQASLFLDEFLSSCSGKSAHELPIPSKKVAMCVPTMYDAIVHADRMDFLRGLMGKAAPVQRWYASWTRAINSIFDSSSLFALLYAGTEVSSAWFSSLAWLGYRAALHVPVRDDCVAAAENFTKAESE